MGRDESWIHLPVVKEVEFMFCFDADSFAADVRSRYGNTTWTALEPLSVPLHRELTFGN